MAQVIFDESNCELGIDAMRHAAYFYYMLLSEDGGLCCGSTAYWLYEPFCCWDLIDSKVVNPKGELLGIDEGFVREAAVIYALCTFVNVFEEFQPEEFPKHGDIGLEILKTKATVVIPEVDGIVRAILPFNREEFYSILSGIFEKYVRGRFARLV